MKKIKLKNIGIILTIFIFSITLIPNKIIAEDTEQNDLNINGFYIIPEVEDTSKLNQAIDDVGRSGGKVMENYNETASHLKTSEQIATGIMNRDTIMNYLVYIVQFLSQLGLVVGCGFIMFAGYKYMLNVFKGGQTPSSTVTNAIIGIIIVIFSYAIMKALTSIIGIS